MTLLAWSRTSNTSSLLNVAAFLVVLVAGCGPEELDELDQARAPIVNGVPYNGHPAVGTLVGCTGTLVGHRTVLTAAHCIDGLSLFPFTVNGQHYYGEPVPHPSYRGGIPHDVGIVRLTQAVAGVVPRPLCRDNPVVGQTITISGFGRSSLNDKHFGTKRVGVSTVYSVASALIVSTGGSQVCFGDSGGPAFVGECVAGVASASWGPCQYAMGHTSASAYGSWITEMAGDSSVRWVATPSSKRPEPCPSGTRRVCSSGRDGGCSCQSWL